MIKKKVWIFTFEYAGIVKVGGLGEVPANQTKNLADYFDQTVFIPAHGQIDRLKKNYKLIKLPFKCVGQLNLAPFISNEIERSYEISFYELKLNQIVIIILSGENSFTKKYLDDKVVYNPDTFSGKICLFSIGTRCFIEYLIDNKKEDLPDIIHLHDFHVVIPFIGIKQVLIKNGLDVPSLITFHLLTWPRFDIDFYYKCGLDNTLIKVLTKDGYKLMSINDIFLICEEKNRIEEKYYPPTIEKVGAFVSNSVTTVSQSYLKSDIIPNLGKELIEFKTNFIWDGCDWDYEEIYQKVMNSLGDEMRQVLSKSVASEITRKDIKKYLLNYKIGHLSQSPLINSDKIIETINEISNGNPFVRNGNIKSFSDTGPLVIATGRISKQKGFETIFEAIPKVINVIPNAKFLLLLLPTEYSLNEIKTYANFVKQFPENLRIIFGLSEEILYLAHIAADVFCGLSRWEPFGIIALEAMASKLPIIATKVGGFQETIIDIRENLDYGTGILIEKDNSEQFAESLILLFRLADICEQGKRIGSIKDKKITNLIEQIIDNKIRSCVLLDPCYYDKIKENCLNRVKNNFRWNIVSKKLIELYQTCINRYSDL